jgi:hypothetical protein
MAGSYEQRSHYGEPGSPESGFARGASNLRLCLRRVAYFSPMTTRLATVSVASTPGQFQGRPRARNVNSSRLWSAAPTNVSLGRAGVLCSALRVPAWAPSYLPKALLGVPFLLV